MYEDSGPFIDGSWRSHGGHGTPAYAAKAVGWGVDLVTISNDVRLLAGAAQASIAAARKLIREQPAAPAPTATGGY